MIYLHGSTRKHLYVPRRPEALRLIREKASRSEDLASWHSHPHPFCGQLSVQAAPNRRPTYISSSIPHAENYRKEY